MITREDALKLLTDNMESVNLRRHCLAVEAVMKALASHFKADENKWAIVGLLHDADYEKTKSTPEKHTRMVVEWLKAKGETDPEIISAILSHNYSHLIEEPSEDGTLPGAPKNDLEWSLYCCDELTGLIVAVALVRPDKTLASVSVESVEKKWSERSFAAGVKREQIKECEERLNIPLSEFIEIALTAMQGISNELGL